MGVDTAQLAVLVAATDETAHVLAAVSDAGDSPFDCHDLDLAQDLVNANDEVTIPNDEVTILFMSAVVIIARARSR